MPFQREFLMNLEKELKQLNILLDKAKQSLAHAPQGELSISSSNGSIQYHCDKKYISKKNTKLLKQLAQKKYDREVIKIAEEQINYLSNSILQINQINLSAITNILQTFKPEIKELIKPYVLTNEEYAEQWLTKEFISKEDKGIFLTAKGDKVRSKSELIIADRLFMAKIPYRYEERLKLVSNNRYLYFYPDFRVLNTHTRQEYLIEHFGMMDKPEYASNAISKITTYAENGYIQGKNILFTFEDSKYPLDIKTVTSLIKTYLI